MPTSNANSSPAKRPGLGRRAISSHAVVTRSTNPGDPPDQKVHHHHRPHRPHVVGGGHRSHGRNPSFGKNLNKLQRLNTAHNLGTEGTVRQHHRKKSAPATPSASPRGSSHIRWDGDVNEGDTQHSTGTPMKKNYSSPSLQRMNQHALAKKALVTDRPHTSSGKKKTVGFELAGSENDDGEWEDTQSPGSTRRSSVAQGKDSSFENNTVLVDPLTFVKRPVPQIPRAASLPEPSSFAQHDRPGAEEASQRAEDQQEATRGREPSGIAARILSPSLSAKAPPAMSSISATARPTASDMPRNTSLSNLAAGQNGTRRTPSSSTTLGITPGAQTQASSSMEGGVSRFIVNNRSAMYPSSRTESDPNTPSSFLPHYHPQTPPSPNSTSGSRKPRGSPPARLAGVDPPSRTQQKLWLQRTAALNTSPPDSHGASAVSPSAMDPTFMAAANGRPVPYDNGRGLVLNGGPRTGGAPHGNEAKHLRKAYEKATLELTVVRRFQSPTGNSFARLSSILNEAKGPAAPTRPSSLGKPVKSAPALTLLRDGAHDRDQAASSAELRQLIGRKAPDIKPDDLVHPHAHPLDSTTDLPHRFKSHYPILSTSEETAHDPVPDEDLEEDYPSETDMMIRRMWESREVATSE